MKIEILSVIKGEFETVKTNEPSPLYRRFVESSKGFKTVRYEHFLGENIGWIDYRFTEFLEEAYDDWMRNESKKPAVNL